MSDQSRRSWIGAIDVQRKSRIDKVDALRIYKGN